MWRKLCNESFPMVLIHAPYSVCQSVPCIPNTAREVHIRDVKSFIFNSRLLFVCSFFFNFIYVYLFFSDLFSPSEKYEIVFPHLYNAIVTKLASSCCTRKMHYHLSRIAMEFVIFHPLARSGILFRYRLRDGLSSLCVYWLERQHSD